MLVRDQYAEYDKHVGCLGVLGVVTRQNIDYTLMVWKVFFIYYDTDIDMYG